MRLGMSEELLGRKQRLRDSIRKKAGSYRQFARLLFGEGGEERHGDVSKWCSKKSPDFPGVDNCIRIVEVTGSSLDRLLRGLAWEGFAQGGRMSVAGDFHSCQGDS